MNGDELATKSMIPGNGINLLDGTKDLSNFVPNTNGNGVIEDASNSNGKILNPITKLAHVWGSSQKASMLKYTSPLNLVPGNYTLSFVACGYDPTNAIAPSLSAFNGSTALGTAKTKLLYPKTFITINFKINSLDTINLLIGNNSDEALPGGSIFYANFKLEAGVNPTPWSESIADQIQELKSELQAK